MKKYTFDFVLETWITSMEIEANSVEEAQEKLLSMHPYDIMNDPTIYPKDYTIKNVDVEVEEDDDEECQLTFSLVTSLKWAAGEQEVLDDLGLDSGYLIFDHVPSQYEVEDLLDDLTLKMKSAFDEYNEDEESGTEVEVEFYNIKAYPLEIENYETDLIEEYKNVTTSFIVD